MELIIIAFIVALILHFTTRQETSFSLEDKREYLRSDKWKEKRIPILERDNYSCRVCGTKDRIEVHHISYKYLGDEPIEDLICLCRTHHQEVHDIYGYGHHKTYPLIKR